jgi:flagellar protein FliL
MTHLNEKEQTKTLQLIDRKSGPLFHPSYPESGSNPADRALFNSGMLIAPQNQSERRMSEIKSESLRKEPGVMPPKAEEQKETQQPKSSKKKLLIIIVLAVILLGGGGAAAYWKFFMKAETSEKSSPKPEHSVIQEFDTFIVNLRDPGGKRFLKLAMKAKLDGLPLSEEFKSRSFEMRDMILTILSSKETEDITSPEDKLSLKQEIIAALNRSLQKGQVQDVYFTEFLIQ